MSTVSNTATMNVAKRKKRKKRKQRTRLIVTFSAMGLCILALLIGMVIVSRYNKFKTAYEGKFFPGTKINGIDVGGKTPDQVEKLLADSVENYQLNIKFRNNQTEKITESDINYRYHSDGTVKRLLVRQDAWKWYSSNMWNTNNPKITEEKVTTQTVYDDELLGAKIDELPELKEENMTPPTDCHLEFQETKFVVVPETDGTVLNKDVVRKAILDAVAETNPVVDVNAIEGAYSGAANTMATVGEALQKEADALNPFTNSSVHYSMPDGSTQTLDGNTTKDWLVKNADGTYSKDEGSWNQHIESYVSQMAASINNIGKDRTFNATGIGEITITDDGFSTYGYEVNQEEEIKQLTADLSSGTSVTRDPKYSHWETSKENNGFGNSYVEIDATRQHLWIYKNGQLALETDIVTGMMTESEYTPEGVYMVEGKESHTKLIGERDPVTKKPEYEVAVDYWMPFIISKQIGMHDASWKSVFGEGQNVWNGSNGCINLPVDVAGKVWDLVDFDMPVIVYYTDDHHSQLRPAKVKHTAPAATTEAVETQTQTSGDDGYEQTQQTETPAVPDDQGSEEGNSGAYTESTEG
uniref:L,D-transpeptidase family protein n=1 Tax=Eubacterium cellulosolvens TaxID=29322 RepID=UPI000484257E|nr:L,D-transpeptidase family protein [[Eubacterium] cellulosolvens]